MDERISKSSNGSGVAADTAVEDKSPPEAKALKDGDIKPADGERPSGKQQQPDGDEHKDEKTSTAGAERESSEDKKPSEDEETKSSGAQKNASDSGKPRKAFLRRHPIVIVIALIALAAAIYAGVTWYLNARHFEYTDDAFVDARQFAVSPKVSGYVVEVPVTDNQFVEAGTLIAQIDRRDYENSLAQAEAQLKGSKDQLPNIDAQLAAQQAQIDQAQAQVAQSKAALTFAEEQYSRAQTLVKSGSGTVQNAQQNQSNLKGAQSDLSRALSALTAAQKQVDVLKAQRLSAQAQISGNKAARDQAKLNLDYTTIRAAQAGRVARLTGSKGQYAQAGQTIAMFVPDPLWITANFKETQITDMRPGQAVDIKIDAYPDRKLHGHVASVQPGSGTAFSLLPAENATGNYVKVVQRIPVKIVFDEVPKDVTLGPGMSIVPTVRVR